MESNCGENNKRQSYPELSDDGPIPTVSWQMPEGQPYILDMAEEGISCNPNSLNIPPRFRTQHTLQVKHERRHAMSFVTKWEPIPRGFEPHPYVVYTFEVMRVVVIATLGLAVGNIDGCWDG